MPASHPASRYSNPGRHDPEPTVLTTRTPTPLNKYKKKKIEYIKWCLQKKNNLWKRNRDFLIQTLNWKRNRDFSIQTLNFF